ncbi:hypothetical protein EDD18DRAFT_1109447 [Armillaria luteobubalina]|uniref:Uncharacterized protein n=1 Tax=Armillaria luteobubalina TaxID=153913 RepID=A0AA39PW71_9AGAR|nr:hypothetical protein EDD18DRAFT_1109447 [Armillaria luteobubalina]
MHRYLHEVRARRIVPKMINIRQFWLKPQTRLDPDDTDVAELRKSTEVLETVQSIDEGRFDLNYARQEHAFTVLHEMIIFTKPATTQQGQHRAASLLFITHCFWVQLVILMPMAYPRSNDLLTEKNH